MTYSLNVQQSIGHLWKIRLFGGPEVDGIGVTHKRFRSSKAAALLAYLALNHEKPCSREALMDALWPDETDSEVLANRLRVTLNSLRKQLEPEGFPFGSVLDTSIQGCIALRTGATWCDVAAFENAYGSGDLQAASELLDAPLLPGLYDSWAADAQVRYALLRDELQEHRTKLPPQDPQEALAKKHRLPLYLTQFIGRESEAVELSKMIEERRLVTVKGPGGVGKTRLAVEVCRTSQVPTYFVPLTDCVDLNGILETSLMMVSSAHHRSLQPIDELKDALRKHSRVRLLFDNADHLTEELVPVIIELLGDLPQLGLLITSRLELEMDGEVVFRTDPFAHEVSAQLCQDRLRQSRPDFVANAAQNAIIDEICHRLDGLPLAIELAAAQISTHSLPEIAENLKERLTELKSRRKNIAYRHRSIRLAIESSFVGLDQETQAFLSTASVFAGGFKAAHARRLTENMDTSERLAELARRSLLSVQHTEAGARFVCLEVIRQLAQERLSEEDHSRVVQRHAAIFGSMLEEVRESDMETLSPLEGEDQNIETALRELDPTGPSYWPARTGAILIAFLKGKYRNALRWIQEDVERSGVTPQDPRWFEVSVQVLIDLQEVAQAEEMIKRGRAFAAQQGHEDQQTLLAIFEGLLLERSGQIEEAVRIHRNALQSAQRLGNRHVFEAALSHLSGSLRAMANLRSDSMERRDLLQEAVETAHQLMEILGPRSRRRPLAMLLAGSALIDLHDWNLGAELLSQAIDLAKTMGLLTVQMFAASSMIQWARAQSAENVSFWESEYQRLRLETGLASSSSWPKIPT